MPSSILWLRAKAAQKYVEKIRYKKQKIKKVTLSASSRA
jgi:hypothetical protein